MKSLMLWNRAIILLLSTVFCTNLAHSQIKLGVEAGANYSQIFFKYDKEIPDSIERVKSFKPKIGFKGGVTFENEFNKYLAIKAGILYSLRGASKAIDTGNGVMRDINQHLLILPVLLSVKPIEQFHINVGMEYGFVLSNDRYDFPARNAFDFRLRIAGGLTYQVLPYLAINAYCSYDLGATNGIDYTDAQGNPTGMSSETMLVASLGVNYTFKAWDKKREK